MTGSAAQPEPPVNPPTDPPTEYPPSVELPGADVQDLIIELVRASSLVSPKVAADAPITWIPGVQDPWITVTDDAVHLAVVAHTWPIVGMLTGLHERVRMAAAPRTVTLSCIDVDTEHDGSEVG